MSSFFRPSTVIRREVHASQRAPITTGTLGNLGCQVKAFLLFCLALYMTTLSANVDTVCLFAQFLSRSFSSISAIVEILLINTFES